MAGLLDFFGNGWEDPKSNAIMALAGGLLDGDFAGGMKGYSGVMAGAGDAKMQRLMQQAQIDNYNSEIQDRANKAIKQERHIKALEKFYGGGGQSEGTGVGEVPFPTGGMSTPNGAFGPPLQMPRQAGLAGKSLDQVMQFISEGGDPKTFDAWKYANDPQKLEGGTWSVNPITKRREWIPKIGEGATVGADGSYHLMPNYAESQSALEGAKTSATEAAKSRFGTTTVTLPGGGTSIIPNDVLLDKARGGQPRPMQAPTGQPTQANKTPWISPEAQSDRMGVYESELSKWTQALANPNLPPQERARITADIEGVQREIRNAGSRPSLAPNQSPQFGGGFGSGAPSLAPPSTVQPSASTGGLQLQSKQEVEQNKIVNDNVGKVNDVFLESVYKPLIASKGATSVTIDSINQTRASMAAMGGTGWGAETKATAASVLTGLGIGGKNAEMYATNAQTFQQAATTQLQAALTLQKGVQTKDDAIRQAGTYAQLKNTPQANAYILDSAQALAERELLKARFYESALPVASKKGDLQEIDREWNKRAPSLFSMPSMQKWAKK